MTVAGLAARIVLRRSDGFLLDVDLSIEPGETVAQRAGKSTAVAAVSGLLPIDSGRIALDGAVIDDPDAGVLVAPDGLSVRKRAAGHTRHPRRHELECRFLVSIGPTG